MNDTVIANLQEACQLLARLAGQHQIDVRTLKAMDLDWLKCRFKGFYGKAECHLRILLDQLLYFGTDPKYNVGEVTAYSSLEALLTGSQAASFAIFEKLCEFRKTAWDFRADYVPDLYEHAIRDIYKEYVKLTREIALFKKLGEPNYIGSRLEDGE